MLSKVLGSLLVIGMLAALAGCSSEPVMPGERAACANGLDAAYDDLNFAKAHGFGGTVDYTKAVALLSAAKIQQQFDEYDNCVTKVNQARRYIRESQEAH